MAERPLVVDFAGQSRNIKYISVEPMLGGFENGGYDFEVIEVDGLEAGIYHIPGGKTTRVVQLVQEVNCAERLIEGEGWFLKMSGNGEIEAREFNISNNPESVVYGLGDTIVWGGETDMRVVTFSDRPFTGEMEIPVEIDSTVLPQDFWKKYHELRGS